VLIPNTRFGMLAIPLLLFPRILLFFAQTPPATLSTSSLPGHYDSLSPLESYLSLSLSLGLITLSLITLFVLVPNYTPKTPARMPLLVVLVLLTSLSGVISWNTGSVGGLGMVVALGNGGLAIWGWWVIVFGLGREYRSNKTVNLCFTLASCRHASSHLLTEWTIGRRQEDFSFPFLQFESCFGPKEGMEEISLEG